MFIKAPTGILSLLAIFFCLAASAQADSYTFFHQTQYPLTVHFIQGRKSGPTVMVQGGIQGDESCGYITAQLLSMAQVHSGNLLVVPRANRPSIQLRQRAVNVDLNRRFDQDYDKFYEDNLARVIRFLVDRSDGLIHLHEGSGFYSPVYVDDLRNPSRFGQSLIIDTENYDNHLFLAEMAKDILSVINQGITSKEFRFELFNTNTLDNTTAHPEQRKSLTYYALTSKGIPAVAVEVSKDIKDTAWKVRRQLQLTCLLLRKLGVDVTPPEPTDHEIATYTDADGVEMIMQVGGQSLNCRDRAQLNPATPLQLSVESITGLNPMFNPALAVFASDRPGVDLLKTPRFPLHTFPELDIYADGNQLAKVTLDWQVHNGPTKAPLTEQVKFIVNINNQIKIVPANETIATLEGDQLILEGVLGSDKEEILNLKGYMTNPAANNGQDAGVEIILKHGAMMDRYISKGNEGDWTASVLRETPGGVAEKFFIHVSPRKIIALNLKHREGSRVSTFYLPWESGRLAALPPGEYFLESVEGNGPNDKVIITAGEAPLPAARIMDLKPGRSVFVTLRQATTFAPLGNMLFVSPYLPEEL